MYVRVLQGPAEIQFKNGSKYVGNLENGLLSGQGMLACHSGERYSGHFVNNKLHGSGKLQFKGGEYVGSFRFGLRHGKGTLKMGDNLIYEG